MYDVKYSKTALKKLKKLDKQTAILILSWIKKNLVNCENPRLHGKGLVGNHGGEWRYRVGDYRLIANIDDESIVILMLDIGHRKEIYQ